MTGFYLSNKEVWKKVASEPYYDANDPQAVFYPDAAIEPLKVADERLGAKSRMGGGN